MATTVYDMTDGRFDGLPLVPTPEQRAAWELATARDERDWQEMERRDPLHYVRNSAPLPAAWGKLHPQGYRPDLPTFSVVRESYRRGNPKVPASLLKISKAERAMLDARPLTFR